MTELEEAQYRGARADQIEGLKGLEVVFQQKSVCMPVRIQEARAHFGDGVLTLVPVKSDGELNTAEAFVLAAPLDRFQPDLPFTFWVDGARIICDPAMVKTMTPLIHAGARAYEIVELLNAAGSSRLAEPEKSPWVPPPADKHDVPRVSIVRSRDEIAVDARLSTDLRVILRCATPLQPLLLLWELAGKEALELTTDLVLAERAHAKAQGKPRPLVGRSMEEVCGDDPGTQWVDGHRIGDACISAKMSVEDFERVLAFLCQRAGWPLEIAELNGATKRQRTIRTYLHDTIWTG